ncbi:MAG: pallilysin-related adhesin [Alkalispirochaetaceae bacterium]
MVDSALFGKVCQKRVSPRSHLLRFLPFFFLTLSACSQEEAATTAGGGPRRIVPEAGEGIYLATDRPGEIAIQGESEGSSSRIAIGEDVLPVQFVDVNLDTDQAEEQIIAFKRRGDPSDRIHLMVADFDSIRNAYVASWEGVTGATNVRTFAVYTQDLVGDHTLEIAAFGMNNDGMQTLDVFHRDRGSGRISLSYQSVLSVATEASIEIDELERSAEYKSLQQAGRSWPIDVYAPDPESENPADLLRTTYQWRVSENRYVPGPEEEVPVGEVEEEQLKALYDGDASRFEEYLKGPWFRSSGSETPVGETPGAPELVYFSRDEQSISFFRQEAQERFNWLSSYKTVYRDGPGVWMNVRNEALENVRRQVSVSALGFDTISIRVDGEEYWNGTYRRLSEELQHSIVRQGTRGAVLSSLSLEGLYRNDSNQEILFSNPRFVMRERDDEFAGGYAIFDLDETLLELKIIDDRGLIEQRRTFVLAYEEESSPQRVVRRITLTPARVKADSVEYTEGRTIRLEQVEELEAPEEVEQP